MDGKYTMSGLRYYGAILLSAGAAAWGGHLLSKYGIDLLPHEHITCMSDFKDHISNLGKLTVRTLPIDLGLVSMVSMSKYAEPRETDKVSKFMAPLEKKVQRYFNAISQGASQTKQKMIGLYHLKNIF